MEAWCFIHEDLHAPEEFADECSRVPTDDGQFVPPEPSLPDQESKGCPDLPSVPSPSSTQTKSESSSTTSLPSTKPMDRDSLVITFSEETPSSTQTRLEQESLPTAFQSGLQCTRDIVWQGVPYKQKSILCPVQYSRIPSKSSSIRRRI